MIIDKEYPATHSMSTSWYLVDDDDNVAIMQFEDEGPIPVGMPNYGTFPTDALFGEMFEDNDTFNGSYIQLTEEQIMGLLGKPHDPCDEYAWYEVIVKIDTSKEDEFWQQMQRDQIELLAIVSKKLGLYKIDVYDGFDNRLETIVQGSSLDILVSSGIIKAVYRIPEWDMECGFPVDGEGCKDLAKVPYYLYLQPCWLGEVQKRMSIPELPVKLSQVDAEKRGKLLRIPGKFDEMEKIQVARWYPSFLHTMGGDKKINHEYYSLLPMVDGTSRYVLNNFWYFDFLPYCALREDQKCQQCGFHDCYSTFSQVEVLHPTILLVVDSKREHRFLWENKQLNPYLEQMITLGYLPKIPIAGRKRFVSFYDEDLRKISQQMLLELFQKSYGWLETVVGDIRPRVMLLDDEAREVFEAVFPIVDHTVRIDQELYPIFLISEVAAHAEEIERWAALPYQGRVLQHSFSMEEMEELEKKGIAQ